MSGGLSPDFQTNGTRRKSDLDEVAAHLLWVALVFSAL